MEENKKEKRLDNIVRKSKKIFWMSIAGGIILVGVGLINRENPLYRMYEETFHRADSVKVDSIYTAPADSSNYNVEKDSSKKIPDSWYDLMNKE